jgi:hypothetical protein
VLVDVGYVHAEDDFFNCKPKVGKVTYDLTALSGEHSVSRTWDLPPTKMLDTISFNLCADLKRVDGMKEGDQVRSAVLFAMTHPHLMAISPDALPFPALSA